MGLLLAGLYTLSPSGIVEWNRRKVDPEPVNFSEMGLRDRKRIALVVLWNLMPREARRYFAANTLLWAVFVYAVLDISLAREDVDYRERPSMADWMEADRWWCEGHYLSYSRIFGIDPILMREILELAECSPWAWRLRP